MRFTTAYYLLVLYVTVMFQPLIPIACDAWCHAFAEANHIATVHAKYGSHHLDVSLAEANNSDTNKNQNRVKIDGQAQVHVFIKEYKYEIYVTVAIIQFSMLEQNKLLSVFILKHTPPPRLS